MRQWTMRAVALGLAGCGVQGTATVSTETTTCPGGSSDCTPTGDDDDDLPSGDDDDDASTGDDDDDDVTTVVDVDQDGVPAEDDCDDEDPTSPIRTLDADCDGWADADDCDDGDADVYPGAPKRTWVDADCSGRIEDDIAFSDVIFSGSVQVEHAGDVDGDGLQDLVFSRSVEVGGVWSSGAYVVLGASIGSRRVIDLETEADYVFTSRDGIASMAGADVDGDGLSDLVLGAPFADGGADMSGVVFILFGASLGADRVIPADQSDIRINGAGRWGGAGTAVANGGDLDGDGLDDLVIANSQNDSPNPHLINARVLLGASLVGISEAPMADADHVIEGIGNEIAALGDIDGDGLGDLLLGTNDFHRNDNTAVVVRGDVLAAGVTVDLANAVTLVGAEGERAGDQVANLGDVDGDGVTDLLIGAGSTRTGQRGKAYVMSGALLPASGTQSLDEAISVFERQESTFAYRVAATGDTDGDGLGDVLLGSPGNWPRYQGSAYFVSGARAAAQVVEDVELALQDGALNENLGIDVASADVNGDGRSDFLVVQGTQAVHLIISRLGR